MQLNAVQTDASPIDAGPGSGGIIEIVESFSTSAGFTFVMVANRSTWDADTGSDPAARIFEDSSTINVDVVPGAFTSFSFAHLFPTFNLMSASAVVPALIFGNQGSIIKSALGASTTSPQVSAILMNPELRATVAGDDINVTTMVGMVVSPKWSVIPSTNVNFGNVIGVDFVGPLQQFFQPSGGTKELASATGLWIRNKDANLTLNGQWVGLKSDLVVASNHFMIRNQGGAQTTFALGEVKFGTLDAEEITMNWTPSGQVFQIAERITDTPVGLHFKMQVLSFGDTSPTDPANSRFFFLIGPSDSTMGVGGPHRGIWVRGNNVDVNGFAVTDYDYFLMTEFPTFTLSGGSIQNLTGLHVGRVGEDGTISNQAFWCSEGGRIRFDGQINLGASAPAVITGDQNDYVLASGTAARQITCLTTDAARTITGILPWQTNDTLIIVNSGTNNLTLAHENVGSLASNRINSPTDADYTLRPDESTTLWYEPSTTRWKILDRHYGHVAEDETVSGTWNFSNSLTVSGVPVVTTRYTDSEAIAALEPTTSALAASGTTTDSNLTSHTSDSTIHFTEASIDHGSIAGLSDDDHTQYSLLDGTRAFSQIVLGGATGVIGQGDGEELRWGGNDSDLVGHRQGGHGRIAVAWNAEWVSASGAWAVVVANEPCSLLGFSNTTPGGGTESAFLGVGPQSPDVGQLITFSGITILNADGDIKIDGDLGFNAITNTIAGIENQNLLDKTATETVSGDWNYSSSLTVSGVPVSVGQSFGGYLHIVDEKSNGTSAGTFTSGAYRTRDLNTVRTNTIAGASLASNQIILASGTYQLNASAPAFRVIENRTRWHNVDLGETTIVGEIAMTPSANNRGDQTRSNMRGRFTITSGTTFEVQHICDTTKTGDGLGHTAAISGDSEVEVYTQVEIWELL